MTRTCNLHLGQHAQLRRHLAVNQESLAEQTRKLELRCVFERLVHQRVHFAQLHRCVAPQKRTHVVIKQYDDVRC